MAGVLEMKEEPGHSLRDTLTDKLQRGRVLLVLDNCEHLLSACSQIAMHLLQECAGVRILATSREPMGMAAKGVRLSNRLW